MKSESKCAMVKRDGKIGVPIKVSVSLLEEVDERIKLLKSIKPSKEVVYRLQECEKFEEDVLECLQELEKKKTEICLDKWNAKDKVVNQTDFYVLWSDVQKVIGVVRGNENDE